MLAIQIALEVLLAITSLLLTLLILLHKGRGGGLSDMFGGGLSSTMGSSGVAERNLNRITIILGLVWIAVIITLGLFIFLINAALFYGVSLVLPGFHLADFASALLGSIVVSLTSGIGTAFIGRQGRVERYRRKYRDR